MNIAIIGTGYIGLVQGVVMSDLGFDVVCIDNDATKIEMLKQGKSPIYEPELEETLKKSLKNGKIKFTLDYNSGIKNADVIFLASSVYVTSHHDPCVLTYLASMTIWLMKVRMYETSSATLALT